MKKHLCLLGILLFSTGLYTDQLKTKIWFHGASHY